LRRVPSSTRPWSSLLRGYLLGLGLSSSIRWH
jgi:hypothetical protein